MPAHASLPAFALKTGTNLFTPWIPFEGAAVAVAADGSVWSVDGDHLFAFDTSVGAFEPVTGITGVSPQLVQQTLAAVDSELVYFVAFDGSGAVVVAQYSRGAGVTNLAPLPGGDAPAAISAGDDGTLWALGSSGTPYAYASGSWTRIAVPSGSSVQMVSVGSSSFVLAVMTVNGAPELMSYTSGGWTSFGGNVPGGLSWVSACGDGSYWMQGGNTLTLVPNDGGSAVNFALPSGKFFLGGNVAPTKFGCFYFLISDMTGLVCSAYGALDQPAVAWPTPTSDWTTAYNAITETLQINNPNGIRGLYADENATPSIWYTEISEMSCPAGVSAANWTIIQAQIRQEIKYVEAVQTLFTNLNTLNTQVNVEQLYAYDQVVQMVELPDNPAQQPDTVINVILGTIFSKLLTAAIGQAPPAVGQALTIGISVFRFAADRIAAGHGAPNADSAIQVACSQLASTLNDLNNQRLQSNSDFQNAALTDWGKLGACGEAISSGLWYWPTDFNVSVLKGIGKAIELNFYQTLMPAKWQIMKIQTLLMIGMPASQPYLTHAPAYSFMFQTESDQSGNALFWWWCCADQSAGVSQYSTGPFPNQNLMEAIHDFGGLSDFFTGAGGWALPVGVMEGYTPPAQAAPWQPWDDSSSPFG